MTTSPTRPPGRPRDARAGAAILAATQELLADVGVEGLTVEGVAERAGVGKTTVYRRWGSKDELVMAAIETLYEELQVPDTGDLRDDLVVLVRAAQRLMTTTRAGHVMPRLAGEVASGSPLGQAYMSGVIGPRIGLVAGLLAQAVARGELRAGIDVDLAVTTIVGPVIFLALTGRIARAGDDLAERLVDQALDGLRR